MEEQKLYSGKRLADGKVVVGELFAWDKFCTAIIVHPDCTNISQGDGVNYFSIEPFNQPTKTQ